MLENLFQLQKFKFNVSKIRNLFLKHGQHDVESVGAIGALVVALHKAHYRSGRRCEALATAAIRVSQPFV